MYLGLKGPCRELRGGGVICDFDDGESGWVRVVPHAAKAIVGAGWVRQSGVGVPSGTVTFPFTDIEGSTRLWESASDAMRVALAAHDEMAPNPLQGLVDG